MKIRQINCKTALSSSTLPGLDYSLNPYRGCEHDCAYCYAPNVLKIKREKNFRYYILSTACVAITVITSFFG